MKTTYSSSSPWFQTKIIQDSYLGIMAIRPVPAESDDYYYTIQEQYTHRPDLLAHDLYRNKDLWWIFAQRNLDVLQDPIYDFEAGVSIYLPKANNVNKFIGST